MTGSALEKGACCKIYKIADFLKSISTTEICGIADGAHKALSRLQPKLQSCDRMQNRENVMLKKIAEDFLPGVLKGV